MKNLVLVTLFFIAALGNAAPESHEDQIKLLQEEVVTLKETQKESLSTISKYNQEISILKNDLADANIVIDSLSSNIKAVEESVKAYSDKFDGEISTTNNSVNEKEQALASNINKKSLIGIVLGILLLVIIIAVWVTLRKRMNANVSVIESVQDAQKKLMEESVKLDNKLIELLDKQLKDTTPVSSNSSQDHSLALKVADEIVRMEMNLSRMDTSIKGHKQLSKAVERIKDTFKAKGYEISDMLGKPYNEGMRAIATFVTDENIPEGQQIITGITKPQILFNGTMVQNAQITVSQNN